MNTEYPGIDYSCGDSNIDTATGIRFGVISAHSLTAHFWDSVESVYEAHCPACGDELAEETYDTQGRFECEHCGEELRDGDQWPEEPSGASVFLNVLTDENIKGFVDDDNDVWITKSPYYTHAQFCSLCAPGAGHLDHPCETGPKTYALGPDWFDGPCPYPLFSVETGEPVKGGA